MNVIFGRYCYEKVLSRLQMTNFIWEICKQNCNGISCDLVIVAGLFFILNIYAIVEDLVVECRDCKVLFS